MALVACGSNGAPPREIAPIGPPSVRVEVVQRHTRAIDDIGERVAGSQEEFAAASYVLGHLQTAGYVVRLDHVPVENLVRSSNVVALPPDGDEPAVIVAVALDRGSGPAIGLFLEVARALRVAAGRHSVQFVALGAEATEVEGGRLGARRLAQQLIDAEQDPVIVEIGSIGAGRLFALSGSAAPEILRAAPGADASVSPGSRGDRVFDKAGFENAVVSGEPSEVGDLLLAYLSEQ